ncbi:MMPL family transporter [Embleya sp. NPDC001921]
MERVKAMAAWPCGRRSKWVVLIVWVALLVGAFPLAGKLPDVERNEASAWLPGAAESTKVIKLQSRLQDVDTVTAVVVYERTAGLSEPDRAAILAQTERIRKTPGVVGPIADPTFEPGGRAAQVLAPIEMDPKVGWSEFIDVVDDVDTITEGSPPGLRAYVTGPAGIGADQGKAFEGIDGVLLYSALAVVIVLLLLTYRSPVLWLLPVLTVVAALFGAQAFVYLFAKHDVVVVNARSAAILTVLIFGAGTDYALLLVARYREELRRYQDRHEAMAHALLRAGPALLASAATVGVGMLCLLAARMNSTSGLGPVCALGILVGLVAMVTLLPALLVICGRWVFWPVRPGHGTADPAATGMWARMGTGIARRPRIVWIGTSLALAALSLGLFALEADGLSNKDTFIGHPESIKGAEVAARYFPQGSGAPVVVIAREPAAGAVVAALSTDPGVLPAHQVRARNGLVEIDATLKDGADSTAAQRTVERLRDLAHAVPDAAAEVGGTTAVNIDIARAQRYDDKWIIPLVLLAVLVILALLLRAVAAPVILVATVVLSFAAALGASALVFEYVFGFAGADTSLPLFVFVFLVALGIDYNIFLMTRVREETARHGARPGALIGLRATGGVITSAGLVLASTFGVLGTLPVVTFAEIGFAVALGVLLDSIVVRSILVTALTLDVGRVMWWPSVLYRHPVRESEPDQSPSDHHTAVSGGSTS